MSIYVELSQNYFTWYCLQLCHQNPGYRFGGCTYELFAIFRTRAMAWKQTYNAERQHSRRTTCDWHFACSAARQTHQVSIISHFPPHARSLVLHLQVTIWITVRDIILKSLETVFNDSGPTYHISWFWSSIISVVFLTLSVVDQWPNCYLTTSSTLVTTTSVAICKPWLLPLNLIHRSRNTYAILQMTSTRIH